MAFTGKAAYQSYRLSESVEDVSGLIGIISPYETPLLDALGDPLQNTNSTYHEWLEDVLLPSKDRVISVATVGQQNIGIKVEHPDYFRVGDHLQVEGSDELMLITAISTIDNKDVLVVERGYAGTKPEQIELGQTINIIGNAAKPYARFIQRNRCGNNTHKFTATVEVNRADLEASQLGLADELDYQKQERLRELLRDLENTVINGSSRLKGIAQWIISNLIDAKGKPLTESLINSALKQIWESSNGNINLIVVGGYQKRQMNTFLGENNAIYESDFGICRVIVSRWVRDGEVLLLDSSKISILPLAGHSFHYRPLASSSENEQGELTGEYTLELKNEQSHCKIVNLTKS